MGLIQLFIPIQEIHINPFRTQVHQHFQNYISKPIIYLNQGLVEKNVFQLNRFYYNIKLIYNNSSVIIDYKYQKPVLKYKDWIVTSHGKMYQYESTLLLPIIDENYRQVKIVATHLHEKFPIKLIDNIKYHNYKWVITMNNGQQWIGDYSWEKTWRHLNFIDKKKIKSIINNKNYDLIFILKNRLLLHKSRKKSI